MTQTDWVIGIDEAGRGPLAGPVAVGVVMVPVEFDIRTTFCGVADSKQLSEKKREEIFTLLQQQAGIGGVSYVVEYASAAMIDEIGISRAIKHALARGLRSLADGLEVDTLHVLLDGSLKAPVEYRQQTIIRGDASEPIISLASIAAKVSRDRLMQQLAKKYPEYGFEIHKGYGTLAHYAAIKKHGTSPIHRRSFNLVDKQKKRP